MTIHTSVYFSLIFLVLFLTPPAIAQPQQYKLSGGKTIAVVLLILIVLFFALGFLSIYSRQCAERRLRRRLDLTIFARGGGRSRRQRGLDPAVVDSFPTFAYSVLKDLKVGRTSLECAVCLSEFYDEETLRLIPQCFHAFHPDCIDAWLSTHSTCPVCRGILEPGDTSSSLTIHINDQPDPDDSNLIARVNDDERDRELIMEPQSRRERITNLEYESRPVRPFLLYNSTGHSPVRLDENFERFTLRLMDEVQDRLLSAGSLSRTTSCPVTFQKESSERRGYGTRSVGRNERFGSAGWLDRLG